jgi:uncharacterized damage-inducible protein DinB
MRTERDNSELNMVENRPVIVPLRFVTHRVNNRSMDMSDTQDQRLLEALLDSWDRNNTVLINLLRLLSEGGPEGGLEARAMEGSPSVSEMFTHVHHERMVSVFENAPEFAGNVPEEEWAAERDPDRIAQMLDDSAKRVRDAVKSRVETGRDMNLDFNHPILLLQFLIFHEGYHHGQIKLALKVAGRPVTDDEAGPVTWDVWRLKK